MYGLMFDYSLKLNDNLGYKLSVLTVLIYTSISIANNCLKEVYIFKE